MPRKSNNGYQNEIHEILNKFSEGFAQNSNQESNWDEKITEFFGRYDKKEIRKSENVNLESFQGRFVSVSGTPNLGDQKYPDMLQEIETMFNYYQNNGVIRTEIVTDIYYGQLTS
jgi:hypothetical protein